MQHDDADVKESELDRVGSMLRSMCEKCWRESLEGVEGRGRVD
jgi:hypothetical protein